MNSPDLIFEYEFGNFLTKRKNIISPSEYIRILKKKIIIKKYPIKLNIILYCEFIKPSSDIERNIIIRFDNNIKTILTENNFSKYFDDYIENFFQWFDDIQSKGSGLVFTKITKSICKIYKIKYLKGSSYKKLEFKSSSIINIQNTDNKCFLWSILAYLYVKIF